MIDECEYKEINDKGLVIIRGGEEILLKADTIVIAAGSEPNTKLIKELEDKALEVHSVGTATEVKRIFYILREAWQLARQIWPCCCIKNMTRNVKNQA